MGGLFWQHFGWDGVAAMIIGLIITGFGVATFLLQLPVIKE
ncbi:MAG: hypothetical protein PHU01_15245 [Desulfuromonadaceae bacterium]|nr:hypothetical protein [Desulfuromonadaceae bacterium]